MDIKTKNISIKFDFLMIILFIIKYFFDAFFFYLVNFGIIKIPVGILTLVLVYFFSFYYLNKNNYLLKKELYNLLLIFFLSIFITFINAIQSEYFDLMFISNYIWYLESFIFGYFLVKFDSTYKKNIILGYILCAFIILFSLLIIILGFPKENSEFNYLRLALDLFVITIFCLSIFKLDIFIKILCYLLVLIALFIVNSRQYLILFVFYPFIYLFFKKKYNYLLLLFIIMIILTIICYKFILEKYEITNNRVLRLFIDTKNDTSLNSRISLFYLGLQSIKENPITGYYNGFMKYSGKGSYMHNILSYWQQYGLLPFLFLIGIIIKYNYIVIKTQKYKQYLNLYIFSFLLIIKLIFASSFTDNSIFLAIGIFVSIHKNEVKNEKNDISLPITY